MSINLSDIAISNIKGSDYCCIISLISKNEAINLMQNADLIEKVEQYKRYIKMGKEILTFGDIDVEQNKFYRSKISVLLSDTDSKKVLASNKTSFGEKTIITLLAPCIMIIKLSHYK